MALTQTERNQRKLENMYDVLKHEVGSSTMDLVMDIVKLELKTNEDYDMLARENKAMASKLQVLGFTPDQISDIANGAI